MLRLIWRKRKKKGVVEESTDPLDSMDFSWWTPARKLYAAAIGIASAATIGLWISSYEARVIRNKTFDAMADEVIKRYDSYPEAEGIDSCLVHDKVVDVARDSFVLAKEQSRKRNRTIGKGTVSKKLMCIRPYDTPQEVDLESRIKLQGLAYWSLSGNVHHDAKLRLTPVIPDVFPHEFSIGSVRINETQIPPEYIDATRLNSISDGHDYSIDIVKLVQDGVLSKSDFLGDLDIAVSSKLKIGPARLPARDEIAPRQKYDDLSDYFRQYTDESEDFPYKALELQEMIYDYGGDPQDVLAILEYAMGKTNDSIEYHLPELNLGVVDLLYQNKGDCDDYAGLLVTLLRGFGIPSRTAEGDTVKADGAEDDYHAWAEVLIPLTDGGYRWVMVEPTWSDDEMDPSRYIGYASKQHVYRIDMKTSFDTSDPSKFKILEEHNWYSKIQEGVPRYIDVEFMMPKIEKEEGKK